MEMGTNEVTSRLVSSSGNISSSALRHGKIEPEDLDRMVSVIYQLKNSKIYVDATPRQTIDYIRLQSKVFIKRYGKGAIFIDYLGLIRSDKKSHSKNDEISELSRDIKLLAKETDCPVILLCQMNRAVEREKRKPQLSDLRDSGAIEQDADLVMFVYRDEYYHRDSEDVGLAEIIIGKHRSGPVGMLKLKFNGECSSFENIYQDEWGY
jgi:replicative DNA helicase